MGDDDGGPGGKAREDAHHQLDDHRRRAAHSGQGVGAEKAAHHDGVDGAIKLLKERACGDGEQEQQQLFPDDTLGEVEVFRAWHGWASFRMDRLSRMC